MNLEEFFIKYYVEPLGKYYTLPATITYAIIFILAVYAVYKLLERLKIRITKEFIFSLIPFVILGGVVRALRDAKIIYNSWLFVSPPIYFYIFSIAFISVIISRRFFKESEKVLFCIGFSLLFIHLLFLKIVILKVLLYILLLWLTVSCVLFVTGKFLDIKIFQGLNLVVIISQLLDAISATISIEIFGYGEQHVVSNFIMQSFGTWIFIPVKFAVALLAVWAIDKYSENENMRNYLKFIIIVLGLALGTRNTLRVSMGV